MKLGVKTTDEVTRLKIKTTDDVAKAVECACCFLIILQPRDAEGAGDVYQAYKGMIDDTTFFGVMNTNHLYNNFYRFTNNPSKCNANSYTVRDGINGSSSSTTSIVTNNYGTSLVRNLENGQVTYSQYINDNPYITTNYYSPDNIYIRIKANCNYESEYTCNQSNSSITSGKIWNNTSENQCGTNIQYGNESLSVTLTNPLPQDIAEQWARANFETFPISPFGDPIPFLEDDGSYHYNSSASIITQGAVHYATISGSKDYRLLFTASRSPVDPDLYSPSPTGYLKVWLQTTIQIARVVTMESWQPVTQSTTSETTLVFTEKKPKSQLIDDKFYSSDTYQVYSEYLKDPIQNPEFALQTRIIQVRVIGYTFDANYTGNSPPP